MYAMVDCNSFYCSCERLFNPALGKRPVIVLSNNDGCAVSRTDEAVSLGIAMGTPGFMIYDKIRKHNIAVFSSNYTLYQDISERVMLTMGSFVPGMEIYSIDEAFLDMHDLPYDDLLNLGMRIRNTVMQHIGIPVCVGIAPTKTLAKMANRYAKKEHKEAGIFYAGNNALVNEMLEATEVKDIWGIGKQHAALLKSHGFNTAAELAKAPDAWILKHLTVVGHRLVTELCGTPAIQWEFVPAKRKNITTSRSFGTLVAEKTIIIEALANHAASCARKLRDENTAAQKVHVFLQTNPHRTQDQQYLRSITLEMPVPCNDNASIIKAALKGLDLIFHPGYNYKKVGIIVTELVPDNSVQSAMFDANNLHRIKNLMKTIDDINRMKGKETIRMGTQAGEKKYRLRANHLSKHYTTNINELPEINEP
jgi:DNA polymerase V